MPFLALIVVPDPPDDHTPPQIECGKLVGLYNFPRRADLTCNGCSSRKGNGWRRSRNGWMICSTCGGRNSQVRRWLVGSLFDWLGANLLGEHAPALFRTPEGYGPRDDN